MMASEKKASHSKHHEMSHFTVRISVRRDRAIGKLNVEHELQKDIEHQWEPSELKEECNLISHFKRMLSLS